MTIYHTDVFTKTPYTGNGLTVVLYDEAMSADRMQQIACEFKQFETIFLKRIQEDVFAARIFTVEEELAFAGHPILGAAAVVHQEYFSGAEQKTITFTLMHQNVVTDSRLHEESYEVTMNQGVAQWIGTVSNDWKEKYCEALNLKLEDLMEEYPMEVVSTGLPYLLVPIKTGLDQVKISCDQFETLLAANGAKFAYIFDVPKMEGRTWDNQGMVEDVATGSAAGPMGAYLYQKHHTNEQDCIKINQGRYVGRPSILKVTTDPISKEIFVSGDVVIIMKGNLDR